jgi:hypothetical protein
MRRFPFAPSLSGLGPARLDLSTLDPEALLVAFKSPLPEEFRVRANLVKTERPVSG